MPRPSQIVRRARKGVENTKQRRQQRRERRQQKAEARRKAVKEKLSPVLEEVAETRNELAQLGEELGTGGTEPPEQELREEVSEYVAEGRDVAEAIEDAGRNPQEFVDPFGTSVDAAGAFITDVSDDQPRQARGGSSLAARVRDAAVKAAEAAPEPQRQEQGVGGRADRKRREEDQQGFGLAFEPPDFEEPPQFSPPEFEEPTFDDPFEP